MSWQIILALLALTAISWWLWRRLDAIATELGPHSFEGAAPEPRSGPAATDSPPSGGPASPQERA
ncbi:MAG: hypothetical protein EXR60_02245 [Dehalococcoidia bacterium]|nr:hypothetical protein [Dehalococcoidia bacterium]